MRLGKIIGLFGCVGLVGVLTVSVLHYFADAPIPDAWPAETISQGDGYLLLAGIDATHSEQQTLLGRWRLQPPPTSTESATPEHQPVKDKRLDACLPELPSCLQQWSKQMLDAYVTPRAKNIMLFTRWLAAEPGPAPLPDEHGRDHEWPFKSAWTLLRMRQLQLLSWATNGEPERAWQQLAFDTQRLRHWLAVGTDEKVHLLTAHLLTKELAFAASVIKLYPQWRPLIAQQLLPQLRPLGMSERSLAAVTHHQLVLLGELTKAALQQGLSKAMGWSAPLPETVQKLVYQPNRTMDEAMARRQQWVALSEQVVNPEALASQLQRLKQEQRQWWSLRNMAGAFLLQNLFATAADDLYLQLVVDSRLILLRSLLTEQQPQKVMLRGRQVDVWYRPTEQRRCIDFIPKYELDDFCLPGPRSPKP